LNIFIKTVGYKKHFRITINDSVKIFVEKIVLVVKVYNNDTNRF